MNLRAIYTTAFVIFMAIVISACAAGKKHYDTGMQLNQAGKYKEAIAYLEQAIEKEPGNKQYQQALTDIKNKLVEKYLSEGSKALGTPENLTFAAIQRAKAKLAEARQVDPNHPAIAQFADKVNSQETQLVDEVKSLYAKAKEFIAAEEWLKAYFNLQQIQSRFPNYEDSYQLMGQAAESGAESYFKEAKAFFEKDRFKEATDMLRKALSLKADHQAARKMLAQAQENDNKGYFVKKAGTAISEKNWDAAVAAYKRALEYDPGDKKLQQLIAQVNIRAGQYYVQEARQQMDMGWLRKAFATYQLALKYAASPDDFRISSLRTDLTTRAALVANRFQEQEHYGAAWYWYQQIKNVNPSFPDIFYLMQAMEDRIKARVRKSIAVFDFNSPSDSVDAGVIVANNLITYLFKNASGDIKILERENLKSILEEMKLGQIGVVSSSSAKEMGRVYGIDVAIMGSVLLYKVDSSSSKGTKTVRYKVGTKIEDNIEYLNWSARNPKPTPEQLASAPPAKIKVPEFTEKDYVVSNHKKIGFIQLSFRIVDVSTGENIQVKTVERKAVAEDQASAGLPEAGVKFDPLEIPTDTELLQKMTDEVVAELGREALRPLQNLEQNYYKEGENYLRRRDSINAAERFVDAIFDEMLKRIQNSPLSNQAMEHLDDIFSQYKVDLEG